jgi:hypothetical protein
MRFRMKTCMRMSNVPVPFKHITISLDWQYGSFDSGYYREATTSFAVGIEPQCFRTLTNICDKDRASTR